MTYRRNIFGKLVPKKEEDYSVKRIKKGTHEYYSARNRQGLHFFAGFFFVWCVYLLLDMAFGIEIKIKDGNIGLIVIYVIGIPSIFGLLKILIFDPFFDTFSDKIKWLFMFFVFALFVALILILTLS